MQYIFIPIHLITIGKKERCYFPRLTQKKDAACSCSRSYVYYKSLNTHFPSTPTLHTTPPIPGGQPLPAPGGNNFLSNPSGTPYFPSFPLEDPFQPPSKPHRDSSGKFPPGTLLPPLAPHIKIKSPTYLSRQGCPIILPLPRPQSEHLRVAS